MSTGRNLYIVVERNADDAGILGVYKTEEEAKQAVVDDFYDPEMGRTATNYDAVLEYIDSTEPDSFTVAYSVSVEPSPY